MPRCDSRSSCSASIAAPCTSAKPLRPPTPTTPSVIGDCSSVCSTARTCPDGWPIALQLLHPIRQAQRSTVVVDATMRGHGHCAYVVGDTEQIVDLEGRLGSRAEAQPH